MFASDDESLPTTGRRLAFAKWLTGGAHPLAARVIVNRFWMHHFGRGLVETPADFGKLGARPSHPELLDWLADEFVRQGWSLKKLHRLILTSTAWRQSSRRDPAKDSLDPDNRYLWRKSVVRLEAETVRDRMLAAAGSLDRTLFGPPVAIKKDDAGQVVVAGAQTRRSLYIRVRRSQPVGMLQSFDAPVMETNCERRSVSTVATQSLMMMNGAFVLEQARKLAERAEREATPTPGATDGAANLQRSVARAWELALCRRPTRDESRSADRFITGQLGYLREHAESLPKDTSPTRQAMINLCQTLLSSNEFLYVD